MHLPATSKNPTLHPNVMHYNPSSFQLVDSMTFLKLSLLYSSKPSIVSIGLGCRSSSSFPPSSKTIPACRPRYLSTINTNQQQAKDAMSGPKEFPPEKVRNVVAEVMTLLKEKGESVCVAETVRNVLCLSDQGLLGGWQRLLTGVCACRLPAVLFPPVY
jgi:hypothetical protein